MRGAAPVTVDVEDEEVEEEEVEVVNEEEQAEEEATIEEVAEDDEEEIDDVDEEDETSVDEVEINDEDAEAEENLTETEELEEVAEEDTDVVTLTVNEISEEEGSGTFLPEEAGNPTYALYWRLAIVVAGLLLVGIITLIISCGCGRRSKEQPKEDPDRRSAYVYRAADDEIVQKSANAGVLREDVSVDFDQDGAQASEDQQDGREKQNEQRVDDAQQLDQGPQGEGQQDAAHEWYMREVL